MTAKHRDRLRPMGIVVDGARNVREAIAIAIGNEVGANYHERLAAAGFLQGTLLRWKMCRGFRQALHKSAPPDAL